MDKKEFTKAMRIYRDNFGRQFYEERRKRKLTAEDVALDTGILPRRLEKIEAGCLLDMSTVFYLARYYGKKVKLELVD